MSITLTQILNLVGRLDDTIGGDTPRERFRGFLKENLTEAGHIRDYVEECLRNSGDQYNRALQDLVNYTAHFLGFQVEYGRYQGVQGQIGFDGLWKSPTGIYFVTEVKTTETYAIKTATLVGYVDALISEKRIPDWEHALGLYVVGRVDPEIRQLENAIVGEKRTHQLRLISVSSLLSLAELMTEYDVTHEDILAVMRPSSPKIDPVIELMARLVAEPKTLDTPDNVISIVSDEKVNYWLTPVKSDEKGTAEDVVKKLVGQEKIYAFGERTPGRKHLKPGDKICFYATANGVIGHGVVISAPKKENHPGIRHPDKHPWLFRLKDIQVYLDHPVVLDSGLRRQLDAFEGRNPDGNWAWFVQSTRKLTEHDFRMLTGS